VHYVKKGVDENKELLNKQQHTLQNLAKGLDRSLAGVVLARCESIKAVHESRLGDSRLGCKEGPQ
jgi:hypothetical protein